MTKTANYLPTNPYSIKIIYSAFMCVCLREQWTCLYVTFREPLMAYYMINLSDCSMKSQIPISSFLCVVWDKILFGGTGMVNACTTVRFVLQAEKGPLKSLLLVESRVRFQIENSIRTCLAHIADRRVRFKGSSELCRSGQFMKTNY